MADTSLVFNIFARDRASSVMVRIGDAAKAAMAAAAYGAGKLALSSIKAASDLAETESKIGVIFGTSADRVNQFAAQAAKSMGQSKQQALDAAATFATYGKQAGLAGDELVTFSVDLTKLASDMASFSNTSPQEAIEAIGAALRGESDPIEKYGVLLNESVIQQQALKMGIIKTTSQALTPQQRVLAAQAAIFEQTKSAQGDFARTSGSLANQQRILTARWENAKASLGTQLLPVVLKLVTGFASTVEWVKQNQQWLGPLAVAVAGLAAILYAATLAQKAWNAAQIIGRAATAVATAAQWAWNTALLASPITWIVLGIGLLIAAIVLIATKTDWFQRLWGAAWGGIKAAASAVGSWFSGPFVNFFIRAGRAIAGFFSGPFLAPFRAVANWFSGPFVTFFIRAWNAIKSGATAAYNGLRNAFNSAKNAVTGAIGSVISTVSGLPGRIMRALGNTGRLLYDAGRRIVQGLIDGIVAMFGKLRDKAASLAGTVRGFLPFSPAKVGPLSGSGSPYLSGRSIVDMLAAGMESRLPAVSTAATQMTGRVAAPVQTAGRPGGTVRLVIDVRGGDDDIKRMVRKWVRVDGGGNVQVAFGR